MVNNVNIESILTGVIDGTIIPYLGADALKGSENLITKEPIPADSDSLIIAMNDGQPMVPKLMYEFPRAAMHFELKRGRSFLTKFLTILYQEEKWSTPPLYKWLASLDLPYLIDINRDTLLQDEYKEKPHNLVLGCARIGGTEYRYILYKYDGESYKEIKVEDVDASLPTLFKPMGSPVPEPHFIASDADYVDYITELMGGFAIPTYIKAHRLDKQYLFLGMSFTRDTERMVMSDSTWGANSDKRGWAVIAEPTDKERRFLSRKGIDIIEADLDSIYKNFIEIQQGSVKTAATA